jgi:PRTRC genetic system ThiF family protein
MPRRNKKKHRAQLERPRPQQRPAVNTDAPSIDLSLVNAAPVHVSDFESVEICIAGGGGTGSFAAMHAGRVLHALARTGKKTHLTIVDPDVVEDRNVGRQLFCEAEIGQPKAAALARRYGFAWGIETTYAVDRYDEKYLEGADLIVLVGCTDGSVGADGNVGRRALHETLRRNQDSLPFPPTVWWLDCGNVRNSGRVLLGSAYGYEALAGSFVVGPELSPGNHLGGRCASLPSPALVYRDLLTPEPEEQPDNGLSCAELLAANQQAFDVNASVAVEAAKFLTGLLLTRDLRRYAAEINVTSGVVRSSYTDPAEIARVIKKPVGFLTKKPLSAGPDEDDVDDEGIADLGEVLNALMEHDVVVLAGPDEVGRQRP